MGCGGRAPQLNVQQDIIRDYFNSKNGLGFEYAYMYPDEQSSAGGRRVIRSEDDTGAVLLIDERFSRKHYADYCRKLAPLQEDQRS